MKRHILLMALFGLFVLSAAPIQADFIQCTVFACAGTENSDVISGSPINVDMAGNGGDDIIFGGPDRNAIFGGEGNDVIFGGNGSDVINGEGGNDTLLAGPDSAIGSQQVSGGIGNDTAHVFVGETSECLFIVPDEGRDVVNLIGFGPYSLEQPFGQPGFTDAWIYLIDPIAGGQIFIDAHSGDDGGAEVINGLPSPNVTFVAFNGPEEQACPDFPF